MRVRCLMCDPLFCAGAEICLLAGLISILLVCDPSNGQQTQAHWHQGASAVLPSCHPTHGVPAILCALAAEQAAPCLHCATDLLMDKTLCRWPQRPVALGFTAVSSHPDFQGRNLSTMMLIGQQ